MTEARGSRLVGMPPVILGDGGAGKVVCVSARLCGHYVCVCRCVAPDGWDGLQNADDEEVGIGKARELLEEELWHTVQQCVVAVCGSSSSSSSERWVISILL